MMNTLRLSILLLCCVMLGCEQPDDVIYDADYAYTIKPGTFNVTTDTNRQVFDRPIIVTTTCLPVITGKGVIGLTGGRQEDMFDWRVLFPTTDTVTTMNSGYYTVHVPFEFKANQQFTQQWEVELIPRTRPAGSYFFGAHIYVDSIFIADSNRMYWIRSEVATKHCPLRRGWQPHSINEDNRYLQ